MKRPEISIIMPTFNRGYCIKRAIESVIQQAFEDWELVIIDDGSSDGTAQTVATFTQTDNRVRLLKQPHKGDIPARNYGIKVSTGLVITFLDSDDYYKPNHLRKNCEFLAANPGIDMVYSTAEIIGDRLVSDMENPGRKIDLDECAIFGTFFIRRRVLEKTGELPTASFGGDYLLLRQISTAGFSTHKLDLRTYVYDRTSNDSITKKSANQTPPPARTG